MTAALQGMPDLDKVVVWVLEENERAIRFYERFGFRFDGESQMLDLGGEVTELRMVLERRPTIGDGSFWSEYNGPDRRTTPLS
jgi:RimJ/RimL family protein N-acetyltransferase